LFFQRNNSFTKVPQCYAVRNLPALLLIRNVQTGYGAYRSFYQMSAGDSFPWRSSSDMILTNHLHPIKG